MSAKRAAGVQAQFRRRTDLLLVLICMLLPGAESFHAPMPLSQGTSLSRSHPISSTCNRPNPQHRSNARGSTSRKDSSTSLNMFMGSDGGILGVGGPEVFTILLVGYFVLGPSDLYKVVKEVGKFIQNIRTFSTDLSTTFENNMESSLQLEELRKAQRELNDAFSFRRSINVDPEEEAFETGAGSAQEREAAAAAAAASTASTTDPTKPMDPNAAPKKKIRRRVRKRVAPPAVAVEEEAPVAAAAVSDPVVNNVPDLEMPELDTVLKKGESTKQTKKEKEPELSAEEVAEIEAEFNQYVDPSPNKEWFDDDDDNKANDKTKKEISSKSKDVEIDPRVEKASQNRFQQQVSGSWNDQILSAGDKLEPMAVVMNKIALLEQEKQAAVKRLEEEFQKRTELEEKFYQDQRKLLEETVNEVQAEAFGVEALKK